MREFAKNAVVQYEKTVKEDLATDLLLFGAIQIGKAIHRMFKK